jgi:DNA topoisomerase-1
MSYILVIVESPAKCEKIEKFLGAGYKVIGSYGHITHLSNLDQIDVKNNYKPSFAIIDTKKAQIEKMRKAIKGAKEVILATDDDREGEAIAWHIAQVFALPLETTKRIVFHEITERAIKHALANPRTLNLELVYAQQGRQILDLIVGFTITPLLWKYIVSNSKNALSAGRCQTPALRLVYDNYKEILESPGKMSFNSCGYFTSKNIQFTLNKNFDSHDTVKDFLEQSKTHKHSLTKAKERELIKNPPCPFTTSGLQQAANNVMHISPKDTMALAQKLYEGGYITYMRTDSKVYSIDFIEQGKNYITEKYRAEYIHPELNKLIQNKDNGEEEAEEEEDVEKTKTKKTKAKKTKKDKSNETNNNAQEAHEAIRPTHIDLEAIPDNEETFSAKHRKLYKLIWTNSLESMMAPAKYLQLVVNVCAPYDAVYKYSAEENIFLGWKAVCGIEEEKYYSYFKNIKEEIIAYKKITCKQTLKELKSHYSEAHLVQLLEQKGIGRPSTFSSLLEKIQERNYVTKQNVDGKKLEIIDYTLIDATIAQERGSKEFGNEKNKLVITQTGIFVIEFLIKYFNKLFDYDYTKSMEDELDNIAHGQKKYYELCGECYGFINDLIKTNNLVANSADASANANANANANASNIPEKIQIIIDAKHSYLIGKHGPTIKYTKEDGSLGFYGVKKDIDIAKLKAGHYKLDELIETKEENSKLLGIFQEQSVYLKKGKYGYFLECGELRKSLNTVKINVPIKEIKLEDAITILSERVNEGNSLVRKISNDLAIRKGKYGDYIFYKTETMKKPQFLKLNEFNDDYVTCSLDFLKSWIKEKYGL